MDRPSDQVLTGDGLVTDTPRLVLAVQTADCLPVLLVDRKRKAVGAFHAGWRGTLARIVEKGVGAMRLHFGSEPGELRAAIGPGIAPCCYAVGEDVRERFHAQFAYAGDLFREATESDPVRERFPLLFLTARAPGHSNVGALSISTSARPTGANCWRGALPRPTSAHSTSALPAALTCSSPIARKRE